MSLKSVCVCVCKSAQLLYFTITLHVDLSRNLRPDISVHDLRTLNAVNRAAIYAMLDGNLRPESALGTV